MMAGPETLNDERGTMNDQRDVDYGTMNDVRIRRASGKL
jgi:hypothetical protein